MKTLKIFLKLKYQETIGACLNWLFNWENILGGLAIITAGIIFSAVCVGIMYGMGSLICWLIPNNLQVCDLDETMRIGIPSTFFIGVVVFVIIAFSRWIKSNWKKATELAKQ